MVARIQTVAFQDIDTPHIDVQAHMANSLPSFTIVGQPDKAVDKKRKTGARGIRRAQHDAAAAALTMFINSAPNLETTHP